ncbi:DUF4136 domain-containing protein [Erythrobacteraceae bacterium CFH 75059]|uniref:DUF4136 domain-containing protein n=1 Tax=Qipengyuania thermophila TaxID=2509361 RepID=UPI0010228E97|nr:DUF4136 domain-containing protein [Qipengyuania thermophila]TCD02090.1 DUF4136 domain-containing protein [Erythrobacteraceae bacterium CFH 75059]
MTRRIGSCIAACAAVLALGACATGPGPIEVTRFHDPARLAAARTATVSVVAAPGLADTLELAPYRTAVADALQRQGFRPQATASGTSQYRAEVRVERFTRGIDGSRSPVSVGVGGSTGTFGSGVGLGVGINLGGSRERGGALLAVTLRDSSNASVWEGRAETEFPLRSRLADSRVHAPLLADALFRDFPGNNGETVRVTAGR